MTQPRGDASAGDGRGAAASEVGRVFGDGLSLVAETAVGSFGHWNIRELSTATKDRRE